MTEKAATKNSHLVEDPIRNVLMDRPSFHSENHAIHLKGKQTFFQKVAFSKNCDYIFVILKGVLLFCIIKA